MARKSVGRKLAAAALFTAALSGCKNGFAIPVWNPFAKPAKTAITQDSDGGNWQNEDIQPRESGLTKSFKKLGETVSKPFKKSPESQPAADDESISLASKITPQTAELHVSLAKMEEKAKRVDVAIEQYQKALQVDPDHLNALLGIARLYDRQEEHAKALDYYRRAAKAHPDSGTALNDLGLSYAKNERFDESIASLQRAVTINPDQTLYRNNLAIVLVEAGRTPEALRALAPVHGEAIAHYNVGYLLYRGGRKDEATGHFETALELDPTLKEARQFLTKLGKNPQVQATGMAGGREPQSIREATESADAVPLQSAPPADRQPETVQTDAVPLDAPITTPYVPQSDQVPKTRPISRSTVVNPPATRPVAKPTGRMSPMNPHQPPQVEIPKEPTETAAPKLPAETAPSNELIGPKLMQKRPATGDRYEVAGPVGSHPVGPTPLPPRTPLPKSSAKPQSIATAAPAARRPAPVATMPPLPEDVSSLEVEEPMPEMPTGPKARTAAGAPRYPASRY